jgi:hypothetical protein
MMLAEIYNKISRSGSNLSDRLEDQLTGDFFGAIRYLPLEIGIRSVLSQVHFISNGVDMKWEHAFENATGYDYEVEFWRRHAEGEIDLILTLPDSVIGIEVKYRSGLSSDDEDLEESVDPEESRHQLIRYSRMLQDIGGTKNKYLVFLAPYPMMSLVRKSIVDRSLNVSNVHLGFLSWQDVLESLESIDPESLEHGQQTIIRDLIDLLIKKEFLRFSGLSKVTLIPITNESYVFCGFTHNSMSWPTKEVNQEDAYVFTN